MSSFNRLSCRGMCALNTYKRVSMHISILCENLTAGFNQLPFPSMKFMGRFFFIASSFSHRRKASFGSQFHNFAMRKEPKNVQRLALQMLLCHWLLINCLIFRTKSITITVRIINTVFFFVSFSDIVLRFPTHSRRVSVYVAHENVNTSIDIIFNLIFLHVFLSRDLSVCNVHTNITLRVFSLSRRFDLWLLASPAHC